MTSGQICGPAIILEVIASWLPSLIFHVSQSLWWNLGPEFMLLWRLRTAGLLLIYATVLCQSWIKQLNFPTFPIVNVCPFPFFCSAFVPRLTLALFPDCIVWFPYTVCGMNSEAEPESFAVQARVVARCWLWCLISLAHEHSDSRNSRIPKFFGKLNEFIDTKSQSKL